MSSPGTTADASLTRPGVRTSESSLISARAHEGDEDSGQPILDLPPLIEPVAELTSPRRPPRRRFLARAATAEAQNPAIVSPTAEPSSATAEPPELAPFDLPLLIEPVAEPRQPTPVPVQPATIEAQSSATQASASVPKASFGAKLISRWLAAARALPTVSLRTRLAAAAGIGVVLILVVILADVLRIGPFSRVRQFPTAAAPSEPAARLAYFQAGAKAGDAEAELQLAILYAKGDGTAQDYATAATWFRAAANQGVARAQYDMGVLYERGRGVSVDVTEAANWYLKAAQNGHPLAQYNLAVCYTKGQGVRQNLPEAALWYRRAATQGVVQAMINLGMMYDKGEGITASPVDAYAWYLAAGRRDNPTAARRAEDILAGLSHLDQIRAQALASDVAGSIHDPKPGDNALAAGH